MEGITDEPQVLSLSTWGNAVSWRDMVSVSHQEFYFPY